MAKVRCQRCGRTDDESDGASRHAGRCARCYGADLAARERAQRIAAERAALAARIAAPDNGRAVLSVAEAHDVIAAAQREADAIAHRADPRVAARRAAAKARGIRDDDTALVIAERRALAAAYAARREAEARTIAERRRQRAAQYRAHADRAMARRLAALPAEAAPDARSPRYVGASSAVVSWNVGRPFGNAPRWEALAEALTAYREAEHATALAALAAAHSASADAMTALTARRVSADLRRRAAEAAQTPDTRSWAPLAAHLEAALAEARRP